MVQKADVMERFMNLEKVQPVDIPGFKFVQSMGQVDGTENVVIPVHKSSFYELVETFEKKFEDFKVFNSMDKQYWQVEVN